MTYLPLAVSAAWALSTFLPGRGLDLWLPLLVGALRMSGPIAGAVSTGEWAMPALVLVAAAAILGIRVVTESPTQSPPFLFGLTVGIVLPILAGRVAAATGGDSSGPERRLRWACSRGF